MFSLNQEECSEKNEFKGELPIIPVTEDAETLRFLLISIYPYDHEPEITDCTSFWKVCKAVQKYGMEIIESKLRKRLDNSSLIEREPFRVFVIARNLCWWNVSSRAACLTFETLLKGLIYVDELQSIGGTDFYDFLKYRLHCDKKEEMQRHATTRTSNADEGTFSLLRHLSMGLQKPMPYFARPTLSIFS